VCLITRCINTPCLKKGKMLMVNGIIGLFWEGWRWKPGYFIRQTNFSRLTNNDRSSPVETTGVCRSMESFPAEEQGSWTGTCRLHKTPGCLSKATRGYSMLIPSGDHMAQLCTLYSELCTTSPVTQSQSPPRLPLSQSHRLSLLKYRLLNNLVEVGLL